MPNNYAVSATQLTEGTTVAIRGKLGFARLTRLIEGEELARVNQRKQQNGMSPVNAPHTTATLTEAEVVPVDPNNLTLEEQFVSERRYVSKKNPDTGLNYSIDSKGSTVPIIAIPSPKGDGTYDQDTSGKELAQGVDVTLLLRVYKPRSFNNRGLAIDTVIVHEAPRYYSAGVDEAALKARGVVFNAPPQPLQGAASGDVPPVEEADGPAAEEDLSFPTPQSSAVPTVEAAPAAAPAAQEETLEQKVARLEAEKAALEAQSHSAPSEVPSATPWTGGPAAGITYNG